MQTPDSSSQSRSTMPLGLGGFRSTACAPDRFAAYNSAWSRAADTASTLIAFGPRRIVPVSSYPSMGAGKRPARSGQDMISRVTQDGAKAAEKCRLSQYVPLVTILTLLLCRGRRDSGCHRTVRGPQLFRGAADQGDRDSSRARLLESRRGPVPPRPHRSGRGFRTGRRARSRAFRRRAPLRVEAVGSRERRGSARRPSRRHRRRCSRTGRPRLARRSDSRIEA
jgi:hypothetical protein